MKSAQPEPTNMDQRVARAKNHEVQQTPWGKLVWQVSADQGNSDKLTVGICYINPGEANGRHVHPNCDEVLTVIRGRIIHTWDDEEYEMSEGDAISIPSGVIHNARNIGTETAELGISFSSAHRVSISKSDDVG